MNNIKIKNKYLLVKFLNLTSNLISKKHLTNHKEFINLKLLYLLKKNNKLDINSLNFLENLLKKNLPLLHTRAIFLGRRKVNYPVYIKLDKSIFKFIIWLRDILKVRKEHPAIEQIVNELFLLKNKQGNLKIKKDMLQKQILESIPFIKF